MDGAVMTSDHSPKDDPGFGTPNAPEPKAAAIEDSILDHYPHDVDNDINEDHPEAEQVAVVDADAGDRAVAKETSHSQTAKANPSDIKSSFR